MKNLLFITDSASSCPLKILFSEKENVNPESEPKGMTYIRKQILYSMQLKRVEWTSVYLQPLNKQNHIEDHQTLILIKKKSDLCVL